ncbi:MAG: carboxypeptidase regulatory-like domain-containing protein [Candidatus Sulfotelmatobacter sp.]
MKTLANRSLVWLALVAIGFAGAAVRMTAQEVTAGIVGTVTDPSGAPVNGAAVTARDTERGTMWNATTSDAGAYSITRLPVGTYEVKVTSPGFETAIHPPFVLTLNQTARVDVQMKVGKVNETIEVTGAAPILETQSTDVSTLIDANTNVSLPLASRDYLQLTLLAPGVTNVDPDGMRSPQTMLNSGRPYINGNREQANEYLIDGILNSEDKNNEVGYTPGIDGIQEFNLISQNASAEFGNYQGGVVSVSTKSGTNNLHGDLFEFFRNDALDANLASAGWTKGIGANEGILGFNAQGVAIKPELRYNQFGGTIGGPIIKDKLFFFADFQAQRLVNAGPTGAQVLTSPARSGDFGQLCTDFGGAFNSSGLCTGAAAPSGVPTQLVYPNGPNVGLPIPNNNLAAAGYTIDPVASNIFGQAKYYPLPSINTLNSNNIFYNSGNDLNNDQGDLKIDYNPSQKDHVFGRWSQMDLTEPTFTGCIFCNAGAEEGSDEPVRNAVVDWAHAVTPSLLNEVRFGFNAVRFDSRSTPTSSLGDISQQLGIVGGNLQVPGLVQLNITGNNGGAASLGLQNLIQVFHSTQGQFEDNVIFTHARQTIKVGFQYARERQDYIYQGNNGALGYLGLGTSTGSGLADFWLGNVVGGSGSQRDTGGVVSNPAKLRGNVYGIYAQDDWRATNTLTVNLGLRFEDHTPLAETDNRAVNFGLYTGTIYTATGVDGTTKFGNPALYNNYLGIGDWQPRVGLAWSPAIWQGKTVIRAGFGISEFMEGGGSNEELTLNLPYGILQQQAAGGLGTLSSGFGPTTNTECPGGINLACYEGGVRLRIFDQNFKPAMVDQWNFTIQQQLTNTLTFQLGYVGQRGAHLLNFEDVAQSVPLDAAGKVVGAGDPIVTRVPGPFLGGGTAGSLYLADNPQFNSPNCGTPGNPICGAETLAGANMSNSDQKYNALQAVLQKRMGTGLEGQVAYTWSKCMSNSPGYFGTGWGSTNATSSGGQPGWENDYNPHLNWGPCYYDQTNILTSYVTYQLPFGRGKQFGHDINPGLNAILGNWEIGGIVTLHSGNAFTFNNFGGWGVGGNSDNTNGIDPETLSGLPDCNGPVKILNQRVPISGSTPAYIQYIDPSPDNVSPAAPNTFGTCTPGNARGPAYANVDLSLHKDFLVTESKRLEFRFEALNAFNHPVWTFMGGPDNGSFDPGTFSLVNGQEVSSNPNFGRITGSQGARELQFALKFYF